LTIGCSRAAGQLADTSAGLEAVTASTAMSQCLRDDSVVLLCISRVLLKAARQSGLGGIKLAAVEGAEGDIVCVVGLH
jgi:hypothetical protein